ncbi:cellulose binding domain-containing protein [Streptomyces sp. NPDC014623]|uniref:cellulose binding domain-containing protein n=1 Tax=Streptomyces sp. NPDC014623 TaxID=3364875 RepID=UPI0036F9A2ED
MSCTADSWPGGSTAGVTLTPTGTTPLDGWEPGFTLLPGQTVTQAWNATPTPAPGPVRAVNAAFDGRLAAGASQSSGFQDSCSGTYAPATGSTLNGAACAVT